MTLDFTGLLLERTALQRAKDLSISIGGILSRANSEITIVNLKKVTHYEFS